MSSPIYLNAGYQQDGLIVKTGRTAFPEQPRRRVVAPTAPAEAAAAPDDSTKGRRRVTAILRIPRG